MEGSTAEGGTRAAVPQTDGELMRLFITGIPFAWTNSELRALFEEYGAVSNCMICVDRETNRSRGIGFVTMAEEHARKAMKGLTNTEQGGRKMYVQEARPKEAAHV